MKAFRSVLLNLVLILIVFSSAAAEQGTIIEFIVGDIRINRTGRIFAPGKGEPVRDGDIIMLKKDSALELLLPMKDRKIKIAGPSVFRFQVKSIQRRIKRGALAAGFAKLFAKNSPPYVPRTIVSAVRGKYDERKMDADRKGKKKLQRAIELVNEEKFAEALGILDEIGKLDSLNSHARAIISYYTGEINFKTMKYEKALSYYLSASKYGSKRFKHREEAFIRGIICAELLGNSIQANQLKKGYRNVYGNNGRYSGFLKDSP